jgi:hypothetical protein
LRFGKFFHLALICLFLFALQTTTLHIKHQLGGEKNHCQVCQVSETLEGDQHHSTSTTIVLDIPAVQIAQSEEKILIKEAFDLTQKSECKRFDMAGLKELHPQKPTFTYQAIAPPLFFS